MTMEELGEYQKPYQETHFKIQIEIQSDYAQTQRIITQPYK